MLMIGFDHAGAADRSYLQGMCFRILRDLAVITAALTALGCGGGEDGPRGASNQGTGGGPGASPASRPSMRTVMYLPNWTGSLTSYSQALELENISYINLSFVDVDAAGKVTYADAGLPYFVDFAHKAGVKVCIALGGATTINGGGVFATLLQDQHRATLVSNIVKFVADRDLDCVDVDLEGDGVNEYYEAFVTELDAQLTPQGRELTAAVATWFGDRITLRALEAFDFVNVMAYDLYTSLHTPSQTSSIEAATREVDRWVERGVPRDKVVYGVPFYGKRWPVGGGEPLTVPYDELLAMDPAVVTEDLLQPSGSIIYLNSRKTIQEKARLAQTYGGIMGWELSQDASGEASLLRAIREAVP
jgi:GH18 family chitinase